MATNFLEATGTNGFIATQAVTITLSALASGAAATGSTVFTPGTSGTLLGAQKCQAWFQVITAGWTPTAGGQVSGWWLMSTDGGTTFENLRSTPSTTVMALPRPPDFIIPMYQGGTALSANDILFANGPFRYPYVGAKVVLQNLTGAAMGTGVHTFTIGGVADQY